MLDKVTRDQEFAPLMEDWNAFVDAAWDYKGRQNSTTIGKGGTPRFDLVPVRNDESDTLAAFSGVMLRNMAFKGGGGRTAAAGRSCAGVFGEEADRG